jgi:hypothetical protein
MGMDRVNLPITYIFIFFMTDGVRMGRKDGCEEGEKWN